MGRSRWHFPSVLALVAMLFATGAGQVAAGPAERAAADRALSLTLGQPWQGPDLVALVNRTGARLVAAAGLPPGSIDFGIVDSPVVNAMALPGGQVRVTRGLLALLNGEAELAAILGHEIGHLLPGRLALPPEDAVMGRLGILGGLIGFAPLRQEEREALADRLARAGGALRLVQQGRVREIDADREGMRLMALAGYDPAAAPLILRALIAEAALQSGLAGQDYNPNRVDLFDSHPASADRARLAGWEALRLRASHPEARERGRDRFLSRLDGLVYGDSAEQGFLRGRRFLHPVLGFRFDFPAGWAVVNSPTRVAATAPDGSLFAMDAAPDRPGPLDAYITGVWLPELARNAATGRPFGLRATALGGAEAATALVPVSLPEGKATLRLLVVRGPGILFRVWGLALNARTARQDEIRTAAESFRRLAPAEAAKLRPWVIETRRVAKGDTPARLARAMAPEPAKRREARLAALNGLSIRPLSRGDLVKLVVEQ